MFEKENCEYIFYASNLVSFYNQLSIINTYKIERSKCHFYSPRSLIPSESDVKNINLLSLETIKNQSLKSSWKLFRNIIYNNRTVKKHTKNLNYIIFLPHLINLREQCLVFNKKCIGYCFVEEGVPAYRESARIYDFVKPRYITRFINYLINGEQLHRVIETMNSSSKKFIFAFGNSKSSFSKINNKIILSNVFPKISSDIKELPLGSHLLIFDQIEALDCPKLIYFNCINIVLKNLKKENINKVYVKFHPDIAKNNKMIKDLISICERIEIAIIILENSFFIEGYLAHQPKINLYGLKSASLIYGDIFGANVFCYSKIYRSFGITDSKAYIIEELVKSKKLSNNLKFIEP